VRVVFFRFEKTDMDCSGVASWGSGITNANEGDYVKRMYVGYDENNKPIFFLRWTIKD
jgi:hypothetical protein